MSCRRVSTRTVHRRRVARLHRAPLRPWQAAHAHKLAACADLIAWLCAGGAQAWREQCYTWACLHRLLVHAAEEAGAAQGATAPAPPQQQYAVPTLEQLVLKLHAHVDE